MSAEEATPVVETPVVVGRLNGRVKWFRNNLGYGFITVVSPNAPENGRDVFVHQSNVHPAESTYRTLIKDEYVSLDLSDEENAQALNVRGVGGGPLRCDAPRPTRRPRTQEQGQGHGQRRERSQRHNGDTSGSHTHESA
jgi:cold shock CspA family protein